MSRIGTKEKMEQKKDYRQSILQLPIRLVKANCCVSRNFASYHYSGDLKLVIVKAFTSLKSTSTTN